MTDQLPPGARRLTAEEVHELGARLGSDAGMATYLTALFGTAGWTYDRAEDVWVVRDPTHTGPGRGFLVVQRGGSWRSVVVRREAIQ